MPNPKRFTTGLAFLVDTVPSLTSRPIQTFASRQTTLNLLKTVTEQRNLRFGKALPAHLIRASQCDVIASNYLITLHVKCGQLRAARQLFDTMPERSVVSVSSLMAGYFHAGFPYEALLVFKKMSFGEMAVCPNEYILTTVLASCSDLRAISEGRQCHAYVLKSGLVFHSYVKNALLHMYSRCSGVEDALGVFETVPGRDIFAFNSMINGFLEHGYVSEAVNVLRSMVVEVGLWDHVTYVAVVGVCAHSRDLELGCQVHGQILKRGFDGNIFVGSAIVDMYGKCGDVLSARRAFDGVAGRNVVSWTAIMAVCTQNGCFEEALKLFSKMEADDVRPNEFTYAVVLNSCAGLSALRHGDAVNALSEKSGHKAFLIVGNALINMYSRSGSIEDAQRVFKGMHHRDIISWNSIITGYSHHGLGKEALEAFGRIVDEGLSPTYVTFVGVLSACSHLGLVDEGFYYLNHFMRDMGIAPGLEHHTCMLGILCRAGLLDKAENYIRCTQTEWDVVAWRTLLSGCRVHGFFGLGKRVALHILQLDPDDVGTYILLSNIYAKENRWDGVVDVRKLMRGRCIKKEPGVSWIQVRNQTHIFASEDKKHPLMNQIVEKLAELIIQIKSIGYVPDIASVLHDVGDEQKEEYLRYHSEKLAIAFGLISTPSGAPIHVMKNLRVCDDCHTAFKLISEVTMRKIVVRDANRFHCFEHGVCSCDDYW